MQAGQHAWNRLRIKGMATGRKQLWPDKFLGGWFSQLLHLKQVKPNCLKPRGTSTPMFRGTWIVVNWSTKGYWPHWKSGHDVYGLYCSLFLKRKKKEWEGVLFEHLFYTYLYIYFSCRLYTTSKKECTKVCYLVHYPTNSIAFACFPKGKTNPIFIYLCVLVFTEN